MSALMPRLRQADYYTEPSLRQLAAMARGDPEALAQVPNFVVGRQGFGAIRFLQPTDVRGLDLDSLVRFSRGLCFPFTLSLSSHCTNVGSADGSCGDGLQSRFPCAIPWASAGSVEVYLEEGDKPEVGQGLNKPAEVTMLKVFKVDKATGQPATDPESIEKFTRRLKKVSAEQDARFIAYDAASGTWRFEVEHFSRCAPCYQMFYILAYLS